MVLRALTTRLEKREEASMEDANEDDDPRELCFVTVHRSHEQPR